MGTVTNGYHIMVPATNQIATSEFFLLSYFSVVILKPTTFCIGQFPSGGSAPDDVWTSDNTWLKI